MGFQSLGTFSATFKRLLGVTPSAYREGTEPLRVPSCVRMVVLKKRIP